MREQRIEFYKAMKRIRMVEAAIADNYNNKVREMRTPIHLYDGQEAIDRIAQLNNRLLIAVGTYITYMNNKVFNN